MTKKVLILVLAVFALFFSACEGIDPSQIDLSNLSEEDINKVISCKEPYMRHELGCCLDQNSNNICDKDETGESKSGSSVKVDQVLSTDVNMSLEGDELMSITKAIFDSGMESDDCSLVKVEDDETKKECEVQPGIFCKEEIKEGKHEVKCYEGNYVCEIKVEGDSKKMECKVNDDHMDDSAHEKNSEDDSDEIKLVIFDKEGYSIAKSDLFDHEMKIMSINKEELYAKLAEELSLSVEEVKAITEVEVEWHDGEPEKEEHEDEKEPQMHKIEVTIYQNENYSMVESDYFDHEVKLELIEKDAIYAKLAEELEMSVEDVKSVTEFEIEYNDEKEDEAKKEESQDSGLEVEVEIYESEGYSIVESDLLDAEMKYNSTDKEVILNEISELLNVSVGDLELVTEFKYKD